MEILLPQGEDFGLPPELPETFVYRLERFIPRAGQARHLPSKAIPKPSDRERGNYRVSGSTF
jgi:hypothetical protein